MIPKLPAAMVMALDATISLSEISCSKGDEGNMEGSCGIIDWKARGM